MTYESSPFSLSNHFGLTEKHWFQNEFVCISNSGITFIDKRLKNRLQLILIVHKEHLES